MKIIQIKDGRIHQTNERGVAIHPVICRNVLSAYYHHSEELLVVTFSDGKVQLTSPTGMMGRVIINSGATDARFSGEDVVVYLKTGKAELRSQSGLAKKYL